MDADGVADACGSTGWYGNAWGDADSDAGWDSGGITGAVQDVDWDADGITDFTRGAGGIVDAGGDFVDAERDDAGRVGGFLYGFRGCCGCAGYYSCR